MSDQTHHQLSKFLECVAQALDISETHYKQAKARYQAMCRWLGREGSAIAEFNPDLYSQGSFRLGTVIKPLTDKEEYDMDLVCEVNLTKDEVELSAARRFNGRSTSQRTILSIEG